MSNNLSHRKNNIKNNNKSLIDSILGYEYLIIFGGLACVILFTIILSGIFHGGSSQRDSIMFNAAGAILMGIGFVYVIVIFMGHNVTVYGSTFDVGMIIYVAIVLFVMFVFGN